MNWKILVPGLLGVGALVAVLASGFGKDPRALPNTLEGRPAPVFQLQDLDGRTWDLRTLRGHPVVINFWATWCGPCVEEMDLLARLAETWEPQGVVFLGVLYGDDPARAREFLARTTIRYPSLVDPKKATLIDFAVGGVPETFFIDKEGVIARKIVGQVTKAEVVATLEKLR